MVRNTTKTEQADTQWMTAWLSLSVSLRRAIVTFCVGADADVAVVALKL
jgi:hypothetical protein